MELHISLGNCMQAHGPGQLHDFWQLFCIQMFSTQLYITTTINSTHTSPQASINLENSPRKVTYVFGRLRGHIRRPHYQSNQIIRVFGDFWPKSWKTLRHVSGHVTRATWVLKVPCESPWGVLSDRHWNFSICSKNIGVMTTFVEGYICKIWKICIFIGKDQKLIFFSVIPL